MPAEICASKGNLTPALYILNAFEGYINTFIEQNRIELYLLHLLTPMWNITFSSIKTQQVSPNPITLY